MILLFLFAAAGLHTEVGAAPPEGASQGTAAALAKEALAFYAGMVKFVGKTRLTEAGAKSVVDHSASFRAVFRGGGGETPQSRLRAHYEKTGEYDFSALPRMPEVKRWAAASGLDDKAWLRRACRAELLQMRAGQAQGLDEYRKALAESEKLLALLDDPELRKLVVDVRRLIQVAEKMLALIPGPTDDEKKVLEKYGDVLPRVFREEEDEAAAYAALEKETLAFHAGMVKFVGGTRLTEAGAKSVVDHYASFRAVFRGGEGETPQSRMRAHYEKTGRYDFAVLPRMPEVKKWAAASGLDGKAWLRRACRAELLQMRGEQAQRRDEYRKNMAESEEARWVVQVAEKMLALIPAPNDDEREVLEKHGDALRRVLRG
jgi:uncharacterized protein with GYD domain